MKKRTIEVFTADCPLCRETLKRVREAVGSCGCEVIERRCEDEACCESARIYGVRAMPAVVVEGEVIFEGRISPAQAELLKR